MSTPLWTVDDVIRATRATQSGRHSSEGVRGVSIDTRTLNPGDLFVPLSANRDGHAFVDAAFDAGAACALVREEFQSAHAKACLLHVKDPLAALEDLARAARARLNANTTVVAVTGSVGKTGTKEMLRAAFSNFGPTHAAVKSFNNHWGVPLTLARTPLDCTAAIYEIGMNHAGEISPLTQMIRPDIAIITTVAPVHLEFFDSVEGIARAKAEIFEGLSADGVAVLNRDNEYFALLAELAHARGARVVTFGESADADARLISADPTEDGTAVAARVLDAEVRFHLAIPGRHVAQNAMAVLAALHVAGCNLGQAAKALEALQPGDGRGARQQIQIAGGAICVIDESYNANPASMRAALGVLSTTHQDHGKQRRIAVLGDMLELGADSATLHAGLADDPAMTGVDLVFCCGPRMRALHDALPEAKRGGWTPDSTSLADVVVTALRPGDTVMIKGSLGSGMAHVLSKIQESSSA